MPPKTRRTGSGERGPDFLRFPLRPAPGPRLLPDGTVEWVEWRGSPELLARVVDAAEAALREDGGGSRTCSIAVDVKDDREMFESAQAFRTLVTSEALRDFGSIEIEVADARVKVQVTFARSFGEGRVLLDVSPHEGEPEDAELVADVRRKLRGAIDRGRPRRYDVPIVTGIFLVAAVVAIESLKFLLALGSNAVTFATTGVGIVGALLILALFWVRPNVEVAPLGQTRLWRIGKFLGTTLAGIIVAGIVKALYS